MEIAETNRNKVEIEEKKKYIPLEELDVYKLALQLSDIAWKVYETLTWQDKKIMGDQFISSSDSIGANIAEGYGRFHSLDKIRFYYNSRGSYFEARKHWLELFRKRNKIDEKLYNDFCSIASKFEIKLNNFISITYKQKKQ